MPILRLVAEGVGPFEKLDLDLSDGKGNPHLGPHILAEVNGSGKTTVLKTIAWVLDREGWEFDHDEWKQALSGHVVSRAVLKIKSPGGEAATEATSVLPSADSLPLFREWFEKQGSGKHSSGLRVVTAPRSRMPRRYSDSHREQLPYDLGWLRDWDLPLTFDLERAWACPVAAYAPSRNLKYLAYPDTSKSLTNSFANALAFGETVQNELVQAGLVNLHSRPLIALDAKKPAEKYVQALGRFESALRLIYDDKLRLVPELEPSLHPELQVGDQKLNFSQLPDGIRATIGWLSDFMMRQDRMQWDTRLNGKRPGVLLLDEIDSHLHPQWQRTILPAIRKALPDVQIIVTTHSPFVISSCPGSRVHVFEVDQKGRASAKEPRDAPVGDDVMTTLGEIFGVESRFDVETERELEEWNELKRIQAVGRLDSSGTERLSKLSQALSRRSELLRSIVGDPIPPQPKRKQPAGHNGKSRAVSPKARTR